MSNARQKSVGDGAYEFLRLQAEAGFPDTLHEMSFPRRYGFVLGRRETHRSDLFGRAIVANLLLDCAELYRALGQIDKSDGCRQIARRQADYLAANQLSECAGGWSYFPSLPELPPDLDSLAAVISLFTRVGERRLEQLRGPIDVALANQRPDGSIETWLIADNDPPAQRARMQRASVRFWGRGADPEVCAAFFLALARVGEARYDEAIRRGVEYVAGQQSAQGWWPATWYWGKAWSSGLCLQLLSRSARCGGQSHGPAIARCARHFARTQDAAGGWGEWQTVPLETGLALYLLTRWGDAGCQKAIDAARACLLEYRTRTGTWTESPWIKMDVGRASGQQGKQLTFMSRSVSTAICLRSLLLLEAPLTRHAGHAA